MTVSWEHRWGTPARLDRCEAGHGRHHERRIVQVRLVPGVRAIDDCPSVPKWAGFDLLVFDAFAYADEPSYCVADDELSRAVLTQGVWEPWATAVAVDILNHAGERGVLVDIGSHVGWYSMLAMCAGRHAYVLDADPEHVALARQSAEDEGWGRMLHTAVGWLDANSRPLAFTEVGPVRLAKIDLEGMEADAARVLAPMLEQRTVDYALVELSPEFGDGWRDAVGVFTDAGYSAHLVPDKGADVAEFEEGPLAATLACGFVPGWVTAQATVLFASPTALP